jgi:autotransporter-associated beta strand protein
VTKVGDGTIILSPGARGGNTYSGGTTIQAGTLVVTANAALGTGAGGTTIMSGGLLGFKGGVNYTTAEPITVAGANFGDGPTAITSLGGKNAFAGAITLKGSAGINVDEGNNSQLTLSGVISEAGGSWKLSKVGKGTLELTGANTYTGGTEVKQGRLLAANNAALGAPGKNALTQVDNGATLALRGGITLDNQKVSIAGTGVDGKGAIYNLDGNNTFGKNAPITLMANAMVGAADNTTLKFLGTVDKNGTILTVTPGKGATITFQDAAANQAIKGGGDVIVDGPGKVVIASGSTYTGPTVVKAGTLEVDNTSGSATSTNHVTVNGGATLQGTGIITGMVTVDGSAVLHPGTDQPGVLSTLGSVTLAPGAQFQVLLGGIDAGNGTGFHSQLLASGGTSLDGSVLDVVLTAPPVKGVEYDILRNLDNQPVDGRFSGLMEGTVFDVSSDFGTYAFTITYFGGDDIYHDGSHNDVVLTDVGAVSVPAPHSLITLASGLLFVFVWRWRRDKLRAGAVA